MKKLTACIVFAFYSSSSALAQVADNCKSQSDALNSVAAKYASTYADYGKEGDDLKQEGEVFVNGKVDWANTEIVFDTPTVTVKNQKITFGVPQVSVLQRDIIFGTPSIRMERQKTGQYPEFFCTDTWIKIGPMKTKGVPKCTVKWSDIFIDVPVTFMEQQKIVMGIPEFKWDNTDIIMGIPEFSMQRQKWIVGLPQFTATGWGINSKKIQDEASLLKAKMSDTQEKQSTETSAATHSVFQCHRESINTSKTSAMSIFNASIVQIDAVIEALRQQKADPTNVPGADNAKVDLIAKRAELVAKRDQAASSFDNALLKIDTSEKSTVEQFSPKPVTTA